MVMLIHVTVSPPTRLKWGQMFTAKIQLTNSKKSVIVTKMTWLLFPLVVLSTLATGTLASVKDASVCDICDNKKQGQIRLRDPASNGSAGQVQLCISGYWQTVCSATNLLQESYEFTATDSTVACYQLGLTKGSPAGTPDSGCKPDQETFLVVHPSCQGWEEQLSDCSLQVVPAGICTLETAVSVTCEAIVQVRLFHGNTVSYLGKAMHFFNNSWRTVCDKSWIDKMSNSQVLCRQLGLGHAQQHWLNDRSETDLHFLHTNINCSGSEDKLRLCPHDFVVNDTCIGKSVPWVVCSGPEASDFRVLSSSTSITIEWTVPEALKYYPVVQGYNISYREKDFEAKDGSKTKIVPSGQPEVTLGGLKAGTEYHVTLRVILKNDTAGPATTFVVSTTRNPNADPAVVGLAVGFGMCGALLIWVLVAAISAIIGVLKQRHPLRYNRGRQDQYEELPEVDEGDPRERLAIEMGPDNPQGGEEAPLV